MNAYIGRRESKIAISTPPAGVLKPPPAKVALIVMNKPPKIHTPAINDGIICDRGAVLFAHLTRKKVTKSVKGDTIVTILTSFPSKL